MLKREETLAARIGLMASPQLDSLSSTKYPRDQAIESIDLGLRLWRGDVRLAQQEGGDDAAGLSAETNCALWGLLEKCVFDLIRMKRVIEHGHHEAGLPTEKRRAILKKLKKLEAARDFLEHGLDHPASLKKKAAPPPSELYLGNFIVLTSEPYFTISLEGTVYLGEVNVSEIIALAQGLTEVE